MALVLTAPKVVLVAAQLAAKGNIDGLATLAAHHGTVLRKQLLLRILLTYLPGNLRTADYLSLVREIEAGEYTQLQPGDVDCSAVEHLSDEAATKRVRKLRLRQLILSETLLADGQEEDDDPLTSFLIQRAYSVDDGAGLLSELPELILPFLDHSRYLQTWMISTLLPFYRRNIDYYPDSPMSYSLSAFEQLPDRFAVIQLLSETGRSDHDLSTVGRDLRGLIGPWLHNERRWPRRKNPQDQTGGGTRDKNQTTVHMCPGFEQVLQWLTTQAATSWKVAVNAVEQWDGPGDADLGGYGNSWLEDTEQEYLEERYARAALASAYLIPEASTDAITGAYNITSKIMSLMDLDQAPPLQTAAAVLAPVPSLGSREILSAKNATYLRNDMLDESNTLTTPHAEATRLLSALALSAFLLTKGGNPCTIRRAGELILLRDERDQKAEFAKLIHAISHNSPKNDDKYWIRARNEILWLRDWGAEEDGVSSPSQQCHGVFGQVRKDFLETELLKALLANTRMQIFPESMLLVMAHN